MIGAAALREIAKRLRESSSFAAKRDIASVVSRLGCEAATSVGDDCAAIPDGDGYLLFAMEGFMNKFVETDPWFAGWCGVMVNVSDVAAMGGRPVAITDAVWGSGDEGVKPILEGLRAASAAFGVPVVGGHTNLRCDRGQFSAAILGRAKRLLTSFDAKPGDRLVAAIDLRGRFREPFSNWDAATEAPAVRLRTDLGLLPQISEAGYCMAAKDISQGGIIGTALMLAECSATGMRIDIAAIPKPASVPLERWLQTFPSFGYLLSLPPQNVRAVLKIFQDRGIASAEIGMVTGGREISIANGAEAVTVWDLSKEPFTGCAVSEALA